MSMVTISHHLNVHGSISRSAPFLDKPHSLLDSKNVHTINTESWNVISHLVIIRMTGMTFNTSSHTKTIILNAENHGQLPQTGHIRTLPNLSLIRSSISIASNCNIHFLTRLSIVLIRKRQSSTNGNLRSNNPLPTEEIVFFGIKVHRTTLSLGHTSCVSKQLCKNGRYISSAGKSDTVTTIGCDPRVFLFESGVDSGSDSFLSVVEMAESTDVTGFVFVIACDFHSAHGVH
mmetsp:Transcript_14268/g.21430  ORF Transcript_14268/g.21430 Transcript_14268/m.21430 type:complete len:232 (-) Transcript_14268:294-989(-)